jgi:hypothetical protein
MSAPEPIVYLNDSKHALDQKVISAISGEKSRTAIAAIGARCEVDVMENV